MKRDEVLAAVRKMRKSVEHSAGMGDNYLGRSEELYGMDYWKAQDAASAAEMDLVASIDALIVQTRNDTEDRLRERYTFTCNHNAIIKTPEGGLLCAHCGQAQDPLLANPPTTTMRDRVREDASSWAKTSRVIHVATDGEATYKGTYCPVCGNCTCQRCNACTCGDTV